MASNNDWEDVPLEASAEEGWEDVPLESKSEVSKTESALRGIAQGVSFGFADELTGAAEALKDTALGDRKLSELGDTYRQRRDESRANYQASEEANPGTYMAGQVAGVLPTMFIPGAAVARGGSLAARAGSAAAIGAAEASIYGAGESEADLTKGEVGDFASDVATSAALGGVAGGAMPLVGAATRKVVDATGASKYAKALRGGESVQKFVDPEKRTELALDVNKALEKIAEEEPKLHAAARRDFTKKYGKEVVDTSSIIDDLTAFSERNGPSRVRDEAGNVFSALKPTEQAQLDRYVQGISGNKSAADLYTIWDDMGRTLKEFDTKLGQNATEYQKQLSLLRGSIKGKLHKMSPELASADARISELMDKAKLVRPATNEAQVESFIANIGGNNKGLRRQALNELLTDNPQLLKEIDNYQTFKSFEGQGGFGSDYGIKNLTGAAIGGSAGYSSTDSSVGAGVGGAIGAALMSPRTTRKVLTSVSPMFKAGSDITAKISQKIPSLPPKYRQTLEDAARRGGNSLAVTHYLLQQRDPEYRKQMNGDED